MGSNTRGRRNSGSSSRLKDPPSQGGKLEGTDRRAAEDGTSSSPPASDNDVNEEREETEEEESTPKFATKQRVYARDASSSLWYEAIIRRSLFGVHHNKQVQIGLVSSESEIEEILAQTDSPTWHYFVHYNNWNTKWDRWVSEEDIMEENETSKRLADRYQMEHKKLHKKMKGKGRSSGDGTMFLKEWSKRMAKIEEELKKEAGQGGDGKGEEEGKDKESTKNETQTEEDQSSGGTQKKDDIKEETTTTKSPPKSNKTTNNAAAGDYNKKKWDKAAISREYHLRLRGLEGKRSSQDQHKMTLPFSLKKVMVEAWEIITQCQMVSNLPAPVTVRQGLDMYLQSKLESLTPKPAQAAAKVDATTAATIEAPAEGKATSTNPPSAVKKKKGEDDQEEEEEEEKENKLQQRKQEWKDMVEGLAMFFDEALPFRLLYSQELSQFKIVENTLVVPVVVAQSSPDEEEEEEEEVAAFNVNDDATTSRDEKEEDIGGKEEGTAAAAQPTQQEKVDEPAEEDPGSNSNDDNDKMQVDKAKTESDDGEVQKANSDKTEKNVVTEDTGMNQMRTESDDGVDDNVKKNDEKEVNKKGDKMKTESDGRSQNAEISSINEDSEGKNEEGKKKTRKDKAVSKTTTPTRKMLPSEIYGCEHLLRLCLKIPELLAEKMPTPAVDDEKGLDALAVYEHQSKQVLAKVNDLIRFLHKNQSKMFADTYRKQNELEVREDAKFLRSMEKRAQKRKRAAAAATMDEKSPSTESTTNTNSNALSEAGAATTTSADKKAEAPSSKVQKVK